MGRDVGGGGVRGCLCENTIHWLHSKKVHTAFTKNVFLGIIKFTYKSLCFSSRHMKQLGDL